MKFQWSVRKGSAFPILAAAFALIALAFSILDASVTNVLQFGLPTLSATSGGGLFALVTLLITAASAVILLAVCAGYSLGLSAKSLILAAAMLLVSGICRFGADLYHTLFVEGAPFYLFSPAHLEIITSLLLLLCTTLTVCGHIRSIVPTVALGFLSGIGIAAASIFRAGAFGSDRAVDLSGMLFYSCFCTAIALCALALEQPVSQKAPETQAAPAAPTAAPTFDAPLDALLSTPEPMPAPAAEPFSAPPVAENAGAAAEISALLQQASSLHAQGLLTDEAYAERCREILSDSSSASTAQRDIEA